MMNNIMSGLFLLGFLCIADAGNPVIDNAYVMSTIVSNSYELVTYDVLVPGDSVETITSKDKVMFYEMVIGINNPTKKKYSIEIVCVDSKDKIIFRGAVKRSFELKDEFEGGNLFRLVQQLEFHPKAGTLIAGQLYPLEPGNDYFIKFYFENKLLGITKFNYV